jgi:glycosyltransferase involved in cell wall biosynthesis
VNRGSTRRVWIVNHYADAPDRPNGTRHFDLARQLVRHGHAVTIFASGFSHVTRREERLRRGQLYRVDHFDGVTFVWLRTTPYQGNTWKRQLNMLSFVASFLVVQSRFGHPDAIIGSTVHPFAALGAQLVAFARRSEFLFEIRDLWPQTLVDLGAMRDGSVGERTLRAIEAHLVRQASAVISLLPGIGAYLQARGLPSAHVVYLPNGVDLAAFDASGGDGQAGDPGTIEALKATERLRSEARVVFGYVGSFGRVNDVSLLVRAAQLAEDRCPGRVGLVLVGDGPERAGLERVVGASPQISIQGPIPKREVPIVLRAVDAAIVHATATPVYRYGVSFNKLFEAMAAGRPVIFACDTADDPVRASGAGATIEPDNVAAMSEAMIAMADADPAERHRMGTSGRAYVEQHHAIDGLGERLSAVLRHSG